MITYLEGILLRAVDGSLAIVRDDATVVRAPSVTHPLAAKGIGHRYGELDRAAEGGAWVLLTVENDPDPAIVEIDEILPADARAIAAARKALSPDLAA